MRAEGHTFGRMNAWGAKRSRRGRHPVSTMCARSEVGWSLWLGWLRAEAFEPRQGSTSLLEATRCWIAPKMLRPESSRISIRIWSPGFMKGV